MRPAAIRRRRLAVVAVGVAALASMSLAVGCGSDGDEPTAVEVSDAWVRQSTDVANQAEAYLTMTAEADDALVGVEVDPDVAVGASLAQITVSEDPGADGADSTVVRSSIDEVDLPAGETVVLEPGGDQIVVMGLTEALEPGDEVELTLTFDGGATETVTAEVRDD